ncbi:hypothetical protein Nepgr_004455 [Nepenthes gracilis]|uniref:Uncharacterized protein n=1 Tax=Nepenthes gracilis TaxID=150966 RepID=A0AAD3S1V9_NEPGR|nr:hypothetical protein Nepgr_004455 [Nepenthes gracilis]
MKGTYLRIATRELTFLVVDFPSVYNAILGKPFLTAFGAVTSILHLKVKFPTPCDRMDKDLNIRNEATLQQAQLGEATKAILLDPTEPEKCVHISGSLITVNRD